MSFNPSCEIQCSISSTHSHHQTAPRRSPPWLQPSHLCLDVLPLGLSDILQPSQLYLLALVTTPIESLRLLDILHTLVVPSVVLQRILAPQLRAIGDIDFGSPISSVSSVVFNALTISSIPLSDSFDSADC